MDQSGNNPSDNAPLTDPANNSTDIMAQLVQTMTALINIPTMTNMLLFQS